MEKWSKTRRFTTHHWCFLAAFFPLQSAHALWPDAVYERVGADSGRVLTALKFNDTATLSRFIGARGLRFSPYIFADKSEKIWRRAQIKTLKNSPRKYLWGSFDGSGDDILLDWQNYRKRFVWNRDYTRIGPQFDAFKTRGNTPNTLRQTYQNAVFVEYFIPANQQQPMNWSSLWLIWQPSGKKWLLSGIAHDEWTI